MARRKKSRRHHSRRRRVGAVNMKGALAKLAGIAAGVFAGRLIITKMASSSLTPQILGAGVIAGGIFIPKFLKSDLGQGIGDGMAAIGLLAELQSFNVLSGIGAYPPPGQYSSVATGNNYNATAARAVGAPAVRVMGAPVTRNIMKTTVGRMNGVGMSKAALGALLES